MPELVKAPEFEELMVAHRERLEMRQSDLAEECGISAATISRYEAGLVRPRFDSAIRLANAFRLAGAERLAFLAAAGFVDSALAVAA